VVTSISNNTDLNKRDVCQALCRCVVNSVDDDDKEDIHVIRSMKKILETDGVSPDPDQPNFQGPLYLAAKLNLVKSAQVLLHYGASMTAESNGENPIEIAIRLKNTDVAALFFRKIASFQKDASPSNDNLEPIDFPDLNEVDDDEEEGDEEKLDDEDDMNQGPMRMWTHTHQGHLRSQDKKEKRIHRKEDDENKAPSRRRRRRRQASTTTTGRTSKRQRVDEDDDDVALSMDEEEEEEEKEDVQTLGRQWTHTKTGHTRSQDLVEKRIHRMNTQERSLAKNLRRSSRRRK